MSDAQRVARPATLALLFGNFAIGTGVMIVPGMLGELADGLAVSLSTAGQLITLAAFVTCIGAPLAAALTSRIDRRKLLVGSLVLYTIGHTACALAPAYPSLAVLRATTVVAAAMFTPQAAATIASMVEPAHRSRAVAGIFVGWSIASVLGMPLGNLIGAHLGWRWGFVAAAMLAAIAAVWVACTIPGGLSVPTLSRAAWRAVARSRSLAGVLMVTLLAGAGQFTLFSYVAPALRLASGSTSATVASLLALFGVFGVIGNMWTSRHIGRRGPDRSVSASLAAILAGVGCAVLLVIALATLPADAARPVAWVLLPAACVFWGLGCFAMNSAQQARLAAIEPALASASIALNTSCIYAGQAIGAALGGVLIARIGMGALPFAAILLLAQTWWLSRRLHVPGARPVPQAA